MRSTKIINREPSIDEQIRLDALPICESPDTAADKLTKLRPITRYIYGMACTHCPSSAFKSITRAMAKSAGARLRQLGLLPESVDWTARARVCQSCPLCTVVNKKLYCGKPFLEMPLRDPGSQGCGCPVVSKARDPGEHCPIDSLHQPAAESPCNCKWCVKAAAEQLQVG